MLLNFGDLFCDSDGLVALLTLFLLFAFGKSPRVFIFIFFIDEEFL